MAAAVSSASVLLLTFILRILLNEGQKETHLASCLIMLIAMAKSTLVGILVGTLIQDIIFATVIAILSSFLLIGMMTYRLSLKIMLESISALFMGAMMGAMLSIMSANNQLLSIVFFTALYLASCIASAYLWNPRSDRVKLKSTVSKLAMFSIAVMFLLGVAGFIDHTSKINEVETEHRNH